MLETFKNLGVTKEMIERRLGHRVESIEPGEIVTMRSIFNSLRDKMATVEDYFEIPKVPEEIVKTMEAGNATAKQLVEPAGEYPAAQEMIFALEEYLYSKTLPAACVKEITAALTGGESDPAKLSALLEKAKAAQVGHKE